jgi:hypothetical protein
MLLLSRSAHEARRGCPRCFYYRYLYRKTGFQERISPIHLAFGIAHHAGMEKLMRTADVSDMFGVDLDVQAAIDAAHAAWWAERPQGSFPPVEPPNTEILALLEAMILGWVRVEAAAFFEEYEIIDIEREATPQQLSPSVALQFRKDVGVRSRITGMLRVINWKTTSSWGDWTAKWGAEIQSFSEAWAWEKEAGEPVEGTVMVGFSKGGLRQTGGQAHFGSPLIWGYKQTWPDGRVTYYAGGKAPEAAPKGEPRWVKFPVWEETFHFVDEDGVPFAAKGVAAWISWLPLHVLAGNFMNSSVLHGHPKAIADFIDCASYQAQTDHHILTEGSERDKLVHFYPVAGEWTCGTLEKPKCTFYRVCHTDAEIEDLIEDGTLVPRVDHHQKVEEAA